MKTTKQAQKLMSLNSDWHSFNISSPANEPGTLMHLVEESTAVDTDDDETKECKSLFKNLKFYLSREVRYWNLALLQANYLVIDQLSVFYSDKFSYFKILHLLPGA